MTSHYKHAISLTVLLCAAMPAWAVTPIELDNFSSPSPAQSIVTPSRNWASHTAGTYAGVAGQFRDAYYWQYLPTPLANTTSTATIGQGAANVQSAPGQLGEFVLGYGSWANDPKTPLVQGPALNLNLSAYNDLQVNFSRMDKSTNINVVFYTQNPVPGSMPLYYWDAGVNVAPTVPGGPITVDLLFKDKGSDRFNFSKVDGIFFVADRAGNSMGNGYSLNNLQLTAAVPEPSEWALMLSGLGLIGLVVARRKNRKFTGLALA